MAHEEGGVRLMKQQFMKNYFNERKLIFRNIIGSLLSLCGWNLKTVHIKKQSVSSHDTTGSSLLLLSIFSQNETTVHRTNTDKILNPPLSTNVKSNSAKTRGRRVERWFTDFFSRQDVKYLTVAS